MLISVVSTLFAAKIYVYKIIPAAAVFILKNYHLNVTPFFSNKGDFPMWTQRLKFQSTNSNPVRSNIEFLRKNVRIWDVLINCLRYITPCLHYKFTVINLRVEIKISVRLEFRAIGIVADQAWFHPFALDSFFAYSNDSSPIPIKKLTLVTVSIKIKYRCNVK